MSVQSTSRLLHALPDLAVEVSREGLVGAHVGGCAVPQLMPEGDAAGQPVEAVWPSPVAAAIRHAARKAISSRATLEIRFTDAGLDYAARLLPQGPDRALCLIRGESSRSTGDAPTAASEFQQPHLDRRGFMHNFHATISQCVIAERPAALIVIQLEGVAAISRSVDPGISEEVVTAAILRLRPGGCSLGQINKSTLALLMETADRVDIEEYLAGVCASLRQPVTIRDSVFQLSPYAGVAALGRDANSAKDLLEHARVASTEARRLKSHEPHFFSDTMRLKSLARLDVTFELREAIASGGIGSRWVGRHDLGSGRLVALLSYARWRHPLRGDIAPKDFLGIAESTGSAVALSRVMLASLRADFAAIEPHVPPDARISYGPLRHHVLHEDFLRDIDELLAQGPIPANRLEVRIAERTFIVLHPSVCAKLKQRGIQVVVDEMGRGMGSLDRLARAPLWGLQLDRPWVESLRDDEVARKVCRAGIAAAAALGFVPIVTGVDTEEHRRRLLALGCAYGSGDLFPAPSWGAEAAARCA
jgi:EAL domain-containing protein (putative c-di-GMP-specific phosphodiesterase class I)/GGDEF domain-containing protein